jgi:hypothetical protein
MTVFAAVKSDQSSSYDRERQSERDSRPFNGNRHRLKRLYGKVREMRSLLSSELSLSSTAGRPKPKAKIARTHPTKEESVMAWIEDAEQKVLLNAFLLTGVRQGRK